MLDFTPGSYKLQEVDHFEINSAYFVYEGEQVNLLNQCRIELLFFVVLESKCRHLNSNFQKITSILRQSFADAMDVIIAFFR